MEIELKTTDAATGTNAIILKIADSDEEEGGDPLWQEFSSPQLPGRQTSGRLDFSQFDPEVHLVWTQDSWHHGALAPYYRPDDPNRYAIADGMDARFEGVMAMFPPIDTITDQNVTTSLHGSRVETMNIGVKNGTFENGDLDNWTLANSSVLASSTDKNNGDRGMEITTDGSRTQHDGLTTADTFDAVPYRGLVITIGGASKRTSGSESIKLQVTDGTTTGRSSAASGASYAEHTATITVNGAATIITVSWVAGANEGGANVFVVDDVADVSADSTTNSFHTHFGGADYIAYGKNVYKLSSNVWTTKYVAGTEISDMLVFGSNLVIATSGVAYVYSSDGSTWTVSTAAGDDKNATHFAFGRNAAGVGALFKDETTTSISAATIIVNGSSDWSAPITVGDGSADITNLYSAFDTIYVGTQNGLYEFIRFDVNSSSGDNLFANIDPTARNFPHASNYATGDYFDGWLWLSHAYHGLVRYRPGILQHVDSIFAAPRLNSFIPKIHLIKAGPNQLWVMLGNLTDDYLASITQVGDRIVAHIHTKLPSAYSDGYFDVGMSPLPSKLFIIADKLRSNGSAGSTLMVLSLDWNPASIAPYAQDFGRDSESPVATSTWETSIWHGDTPAEGKALLALIIWGKNISSTNTIGVKFGVDGAVPTTTSLGTFNGTDSVQTLYFEGVTSPTTAAIGRMLQLQFTHTLPLADTGTGPQIYAFAVISALRVDRLRTFQAEIEVSPQMITDAGLDSPDDPGTVHDSLHTMEVQDYPVRLWYYPAGTEEDETKIEKVSVFIKDIRHIRRAGQSDRLQLIMQEAKTAA